MALLGRSRLGIGGWLGLSRCVGAVSVAAAIRLLSLKEVGVRIHMLVRIHLVDWQYIAGVGCFLGPWRESLLDDSTAAVTLLMPHALHVEILLLLQIVLILRELVEELRSLQVVIRLQVVWLLQEVGLGIGKARLRGMELMILPSLIVIAVEVEGRVGNSSPRPGRDAALVYVA